ncbi:MAG: dihydropteroate synthase [Deltaproteobacteria bacterium]|nr:dihydropteroate synthase [Deltaproteobacteria bacterium]
MGVADLAGVVAGDGQPVRIIGVINVSPESFYAASVASFPDALSTRARQMVEEGAEILDIGAMSTAPYRQTAISEEEEIRRMTAAITTLRAAVAVPLSADTQRATVAAAALAAGASIINDVSGLRHDPRMAAVAAQAQGVILMALGETAAEPEPVQMILRLLRESLTRARQAGIADRAIVLDPGIGFHRRAALAWDEIDALLIRELPQLAAFDRPLLVGISRKSFVGKWTGRQDPGERLFGSLGATAVAVYNGAALVRTHDVAATCAAVRVAERLRG